MGTGRMDTRDLLDRLRAHIELLTTERDEALVELRALRASLGEDDAPRRAGIARVDLYLASVRGRR